MFREDFRLSTNSTSNNELKGRTQAAGFLTLFHRHPVISALLITAVDVVIAVLVGLVATSILPMISQAATGVSKLPDFIALCVVALLTAVLVSILGWWRIVGWNRPAQWRNLGLLILPALLVLLPLIKGFKAVDVGTVVFLLVGYLLVGFHEETIFRGVILRILRPKGVWFAVLISSLLFSLAHSTNLFLRFSGQPTLVGLQMIGTFTFGIGMAALRLRTNTLWPLMLLHAISDLFLALGQLPVPLISAVEDVILLIYAFFLIRGIHQEKLRTDTNTLANSTRIEDSAILSDTGDQEVSRNRQWGARESEHASN